MDQKIDLHIHTKASDGIYSPEELVEYAHKNKIIALAITDHDTIDGIPPAVTHALKFGLKIVPGIEFSIAYDNGTFHLLGYYIDCKNKNLINECKRLTLLRETRAYRIIDDLKKYNINIPRDEVEREARKTPIGRPHIARLMVKHKYAENINQVFQNYLVSGKPGYVKKERIDLGYAVTLIKEAGGIPVIAHPITLNFESFKIFEKQLKEFAGRGISGVEVFSYMHNPVQIEEFYKITEKLNLIITGGSDFHGDKEQKIGFYNDENIIPVELLLNMENKAKSFIQIDSQTSIT